MLLENPSTYVGIAESVIPEVEFLAEIARRTGCELLLDVNNVLVSARNQGQSAMSYLDAFPLDRVGEAVRRSLSMRMVRRSRTRSGRPIRKSSPAPDRCRP